MSAPTPPTTGISSVLSRLPSQHKPCWVAVPEGHDTDILNDLLTAKGVSGVILRTAPEHINAGDERIGYGAENGKTWTLPHTSAKALIFLGPRNRLPRRLLLAALRRRISTLICFSFDGWHEEALFTTLLREGLAFFRARIDQSRSKLAEKLPPPIRQFAAANDSETSQNLERRDQGTRIADFLDAPPILPSEAFVGGRTALCNNGLAWGGAERQLVTTILGLKERGHEDLHLICEDTSSAPYRAFYQQRMDAADIEVTETSRLMVRMSLGQASPDPILRPLIERLKLLPPFIADAVLAHAQIFATLRPSVVHAWQDSTNVIAGLAAAAVGVPRIVLSGRNMAPIRFAYYQPYMKPGYQALLSLPNVTLLNNSAAGRDDYAHWLETPPSNIGVLRNGIDPTHWVKADPDRIAARKAEIGLDPNALVIGSIFRLYEEKNPHLWLETAARIAKSHPQVQFVIFGEGPMLDDVRARLPALGLEGRLFLPGPEKDAPLALSLMDLFLLTSTIEGTPNVVIEAQLMGLPVVATPAGGTAEAIQQGITGFVSQDWNAEELATLLRRFLTDPALTFAARSAAPDFARDRFGIGRMIEETQAVYGKINNQ